MKKNIIYFILVILIYGCTQDPKSKIYSEETVKEDIIEFSDEERRLIMTYVMRQTWENVFSDDTTLNDIKTKTYGEMIISQLSFETEQKFKDSLERVEEEKNKLILKQKQDSLRKLVDFTVLDIYEDKQYQYDNSLVPHIKINMKSIKGKRVNSLKFYFKVFDKKGNELGSILLKNDDSFKNSDSGLWVVSRYKDLYSVLKGSKMEDYTYDFSILSMIYDGELIELD